VFPSQPAYQAVSASRNSAKPISGSWVFQLDWNHQECEEIAQKVLPSVTSAEPGVTLSKTTC